MIVRYIEWAGIVILMALLNIVLLVLVLFESMLDKECYFEDEPEATIESMRFWWNLRPR